MVGKGGGWPPRGRCAVPLWRKRKPNEQERACVQAAPGLVMEMELGIDPALPLGLVIGCEVLARETS